MTAHIEFGLACMAALFFPFAYLAAATYVGLYRPIWVALIPIYNFWLAIDVWLDNPDIEALRQMELSTQPYDSMAVAVDQQQQEARNGTYA